MSARQPLVGCSGCSRLMYLILYVDRVVKANYSFAKGKLTDKDIETVVKDVTKIVK